ncbi:MAG: hypothetical protein GPJ54_14285 [Candidatus Heimdallarchaeota archaeon]|nr:hypothetical protein [Candidatus Heimdallarchaeota archaeon]
MEKRAILVLCLFLIPSVSRGIHILPPIYSSGDTNDSSQTLMTSQEIPTSQPEVSYQAQILENGIFQLFGSWKEIDNYPIREAQINGSVFLNSSTIEKIQTFTLRTNSYGNFSWVNVFNQVGKYIYELNFRKSGYQGWDLVFEVEVVPYDHSYNIQIGTVGELTSGKEFVITAFITNADEDSDQYGSAVADLEVHFSIELLYTNEDRTGFQLISVTDYLGIAIVRLTSEMTENLKEIKFIGASIPNSTATVNVAQNNLPIINQPAEKDLIKERIVVTLHDNLALIFMGTLLGLGTITALVIRRKASTPNIEMWPKYEN